MFDDFPPFPTRHGQRQHLTTFLPSFQTGGLRQMVGSLERPLVLVFPSSLGRYDVVFPFLFNFMITGPDKTSVMCQSSRVRLGP